MRQMDIEKEILERVRKNPGLSASEIVEPFLQDKGRTSLFSAVRMLEAGNFVKVSHRGRKKILSVTEKGEQFLRGDSP